MSTVLSFVLKYCRKFITVVTVASLPPQEGHYVIDGALITSSSSDIDTFPHTMTQLAFCCYLVISRQVSADTTATPDVLSVYN